MTEENDDRLFRKWEVLERWKPWGVDSRKLAEYVRDGLIAFDRNGTKLPTKEAWVIDIQGDHEGFLT